MPKHSNREQVIDYFESTSKPLLEISHRIEMIEKARQGFEQFRKSYEAGDDDWQHFLTETKMGKELQAVYLGIKPLMSIYKETVKSERMVRMIEYYSEDDFVFLDMQSSKRDIMMFSEKSLGRVLTQGVREPFHLK